MRIVVVGDGKVGYVLTQQLSQEGHEVVVIDRDAAVLHASQEQLDVAVVIGNGATVETQQEAGVAESDLLIAATSSDEVNLLCALVARKLGCRHTIARVRNPEYDQQISLLKNDLGLSFAINPEKSAAQEIFRLLQFPSFLKRDSFAGGRAEMVEIKLNEKSEIAGKRLDQLGEMLKLNVLVCAVDRGGDIIIPSGAFTLQRDDRVTVAAPAAELAKLIHRFGVDTQRIKKVMIVGGSTIAAYLTRMLIEAGVEVTIIEQSLERCELLSDQLPKALIINGNGTAQSLLLNEGLRETDAVVTLTGMDEENLLISMFANHVGVPKTITKINRIEYTDVFSGMGIDTTVSPKLLTANAIVRYVRAVGESREGSVETLYRIVGGKAEALGFTVPEGGRYLGVSLSELSLRPGILLATIVRGRRVIIPRGADSMQAGDSIIVVASPEMAISNLTDIFADSEGIDR